MQESTGFRKAMQQRPSEHESTVQTIRNGERHEHEENASADAFGYSVGRLFCTIALWMVLGLSTICMPLMLCVGGFSFARIKPVSTKVAATTYLILPAERASSQTRAVDALSRFGLFYSVTLHKIYYHRCIFEQKRTDIKVHLFAFLNNTRWIAPMLRFRIAETCAYAVSGTAFRHHRETTSTRP